MFVLCSTGANWMMIRETPGLWGEITMQQCAWGLVGTTPNSWSLVEDDNGDSHTLNDVWLLDIGSWRWREVRVCEC